MATPAELFAVVGDISTYPEWLDVVSHVEATEESDAWLVTLKARVGPFSRSKRLRMVRTIHDPGSVSEVRFERREIDGKEHSDWVLAATVQPAEGGDPTQRSTVSLELDYDGAMWSGLLDGVLGAAADRATAKLQAYVRP